MKKIGITGQSGFIGTHLAKYVEGREDTSLVPFEDAFFDDVARLRRFVAECDVIVHLAGATRMSSEEELYKLNIGLVQKLITAMDAEKAKPLVMFASSTHEVRDTAYGRAKRDGRIMFEEWAKRNGASFVGFVFPNIYGPGARVHYVSFIANFAWELNHGEAPKIIVDALMKLKYIGNLCRFIGDHFTFSGISKVDVPCDFEMKVSDILSVFMMFRRIVECGAVAELDVIRSQDNNMANLCETFLSYK